MSVLLMVIGHKLTKNNTTSHSVLTQQSKILVSVINKAVQSFTLVELLGIIRAAFFNSHKI